MRGVALGQARRLLNWGEQGGGWEGQSGLIRPSGQALSLDPANELPLDYPLPPLLRLLCQIEFAF